MLRMVFASLRRRTGRALAVLLGVLVATAGFTVLTGSTETSRLRVTGTVDEHARGAYDILVRPAGARTSLEEQRRLVRPNFLAGGYGGIELDQWRAIARVPGVEVAAPIAMLGYGYTETTVEVDITGAVDRSATRQLIEVRPVWMADRGPTEAADDVPGLVYVTTRPVAWPTEHPEVNPGERADIDYTDGERRPSSTSSCQPRWTHFGLPYEIQEDGTGLLVCPGVPASGDPDQDPGRVGWTVAQLTGDGGFVVRGERSERLTARRCRASLRCRRAMAGSWSGHCRIRSHDGYEFSIRHRIFGWIVSAGGLRTRSRSSRRRPGCAGSSCARPGAAGDSSLSKRVSKSTPASGGG